MTATLTTQPPVENGRYFFATAEESAYFINNVLKYKGKTVILDQDSASFLKKIMQLAKQMPIFVYGSIATLAHGNDSYREKEMKYRTYILPLIRLQKWLTTVPDMIFPNTELGNDFKKLMRYAIGNSVSLRESYEINYDHLYTIQDCYREPEFEIEDDEDRHKKILYLSRIFGEMMAYAMKHQASITFPLWSLTDLEAFGEVRMLTGWGRRSEPRVTACLGRMSFYEQCVIGVSTLRDLEIACNEFGLRKIEMKIYRIGESFAKNPVLRATLENPNLDITDIVDMYRREEERIYGRCQANVLIFAETPRFATFCKRYSQKTTQLTSNV